MASALAFARPAVDLPSPARQRRRAGATPAFRGVRASPRGDTRADFVQSFAAIHSAARRSRGGPIPVPKYLNHRLPDR